MPNLPLLLLIGSCRHLSLSPIWSGTALGLFIPALSDSPDSKWVPPGSGEEGQESDGGSSRLPDSLKSPLGK